MELAPDREAASYGRLHSNRHPQYQWLNYSSKSETLPALEEKMTPYSPVSRLIFTPAMYLCFQAKAERGQ